MLVVEGFSTSSGDFSVTMNCRDESSGFLDGNITCGQTVHGSTVNAGSHVGNGASDHIYSFTMEPGMQVTLHLLHF